MMKRVLNGIDFSVPKIEYEEIERQTKEIVGDLEKQIKKLNLRAEVFLGGSYAKKTLTKSEEYDIDIFVRFDKGQKDIDKLLKKICDPILKDYNKNKIHGSRDYFRI